MGTFATGTRRPLLAATSGASFLLAALASHLVAMQSSGLEALWPSNAIILALLLLAARDRRDMLVIAFGEAFGSILLHVFRADAVSTTMLLTAANVTETFLTFFFLRLLGVKDGLIDRVGNFFALVLASAGAGIFSSTIGALGLLSRSIPFIDGWVSWFVSGVLSALLVTPGAVIAAEILARRRIRGLAGKDPFEAIAILSLVAAVTAYVFFQSRMPLTFIVAPCVLLATFRFRTIGAVTSVGIVAIVTAYATASHHGPIALLLHDPGSQVLLLQLFIATTMLSALPVAAILNERERQAEETRAFAEHFKSVVENIGEVIFRIDPQGRWTYLNPAWEALTGHALDKSLGRSWLELIEPSERVELTERIGSVLRGEDRSTRRVMRLETPSGLRWVELFVQGLSDQQGRITCATGTLRDIDDRKRLEEHVITAKRRAEQRAREATLLASTDELTGIANRRAFMGQLDREIAAAAEFGWPLAVAMFDVDHFKLVNDRYGHAVGDRVLQLIAARAAAVVRGGDMVGRLGGEEFGILMPGASPAEAAVVAERLREAMEATGDGDESLPAVTVSVGISARDSQGNAAAMLADADVALYAAKGEGRNRVRIAA